MARYSTQTLKLTRNHVNDFAWLLRLFLAFFDVSPSTRFRNLVYQIASFIEQKGEKAAATRRGLFSLLSLYIILVISAITE
jgi:hypothetical protein